MKFILALRSDDPAVGYNLSALFEAKCVLYNEPIRPTSSALVRLGAGERRV